MLEIATILGGVAAIIYFLEKMWPVLARWWPSLGEKPRYLPSRLLSLLRRQATAVDGTDATDPPVVSSVAPREEAPHERKTPLRQLSSEERYLWTNPKDGTILVFLPAGRFRMGSRPNELQESGFAPNPSVPDELVPHSVLMDGSWIARTPVTNRQYRTFCKETGRKSPERMDDPLFSGPDQPVIGVSWLDASEYVAWAGLRLPTEAEWEYAAAGVEGRLFPWGNGTPTPEHANFGGSESGTSNPNRHVRGASPNGILDLAGNVLEWCADDTRVYTTGEHVNPVGPTDTGYRAIRGGSLRRPPNQLRSRYRDRRMQDSTWGSTGIRPALSRLP